MENITSATVTPKKPGFFKHIFHENSKGELLNILQYCLMVIVPIGIIIRNVNFFFPKVDKTKGSVELVAEALGQLCLIFVILYFLHRIVSYASPWGGGERVSINFPTLIMLMLWIVLSFGLGHVGAKIDAVWNKLLPLPRANFWDEDTPKKGRKKAKGSVVKVTQPLARLPPPVPTHQVSRADYASTQQHMTPPIVPQLQQSGQIPSFPSDNMNAPSMINQQYGEKQQYGSMSQYNQALETNTEAQGHQQDPNFNQMYANGGGSGGMIQEGMQGMEPMAANAVLGGGFTSF